MKQLSLNIETLEAYMSKLPFSNRVMIYFIPVILIAVSIFIFISPSQTETMDTLIQENSNLQSRSTSKRPTRYLSKIASNEKNILLIKEELQNKKDDLNYLNSKLSGVKFTTFDEQIWTRTLDDILKNSVDLSLEINYVKNKDSKLQNNGKGVILNKYVEIQGTGKYHDVISFIGFIENIQMLMDIKNIEFSIYEENLINFFINFTIYKVEL